MNNVHVLASFFIMESQLRIHLRSKEASLRDSWSGSDGCVFFKNLVTEVAINS